MANIRVRAFAGMIPTLEPKLLPNENAAFCVNCKLDTGKLRAFGLPSNRGVAPRTAEFTHHELYGRIFGVTNGQYPIAPRGLRQNIYANRFDSILDSVSTRIFSVADGVLRSNVGGTQYQIGVPAGPRVFMNGVTPGLRSRHQHVRTYCATYVNLFGEEGAMGQTTGEFGCFEGDTVNLLLIPSITGAYEFGLRGIRIYRSVANYTTGEELANKFDTDYHLVADLRLFQNINTVLDYADGAATDAIPGDLLLSKEFFMPAVLDVRGIAELESGYMAIAYANGTIKLSERFMVHAYPLRNEITIPTAIDSMVAKGDTLYITCKNSSAYRINVVAEAAGPRFDVQKYPDRYVSIAPRSLVVTDSGAMFSSQRGLVALTPETQILVTQNFIHPEIWNRDYAPSKGAWFNGYYFGIGPTYAWMLDARDTISGQTEFGKLTTISDTLIPHRYGNDLDSYYVVDKFIEFVVQGMIYSWDGLERDAMRSAALYAPYLWRSKTYVNSSPITYAAAKVTFASRQALPGELTFRLYGDGVLKYERPVFTDRPFRLPHLYKSLDWHFELEGTAEVHEVHIATSMDDLSMEPV